MGSRVTACHLSRLSHQSIRCFLLPPWKLWLSVKALCLQWKKRNLAWDPRIKFFCSFAIHQYFLPHLKGICWKRKCTQMIFRCEWISRESPGLGTSHTLFTLSLKLLRHHASMVMTFQAIPQDFLIQVNRIIHLNSLQWCRC